MKDYITNPSLSRIDNITCLQTLTAQKKHIFKQTVRAVLFLVRQGLALCGDKEEINSIKHPRKLLALLKDDAERDDILNEHLKHPIHICYLHISKIAK